MYWLGIVANALPQFCRAHLRVIADLIDALPIENSDDEEAGAVHWRTEKAVLTDERRVKSSKLDAGADT
jgi:hypothetical protein